MRTVRYGCFLGCFVLMGMIGVVTSVHADILAQWTFDDPNDPGLDSSVPPDQNGYDLVLDGEANSVEGQLVLNGAMDRAIGDTWPAFQFSDPNTAFSISLLAKCAALPNEPAAFISKWNATDSNCGWWVGLMPTGQLMMQVSEDGTADDGIRVITDEVIDVNTWYQLAFLVDPNQDHFDIVIDGNAVAVTHALLKTDINDIYPSDTVLVVGSTEDANAFTGSLDNVTVYTHLLTPDDFWDLKPTENALVGIEPNTINLASQGNWVTGFLALPDHYDANQLDPNAVFLERTIPAVRSWIDDVNNLLMAKFDRAALGDLLQPGDVELTISAKLNDGLWLEGSYTVKVINPQASKTLVNYKAQQLTVKGSKATIGGDLEITKYGLMNQSGVDDSAAEVTVAFYLSVDPNIVPVDDIYLGQATLAGLAPHDHVNDSILLSIPDGLSPGPYYVGMVVDPDNTIAESNENDNTHVRDEPLNLSSPK